MTLAAAACTALLGAGVAGALPAAGAPPDGSADSPAAQLPAAAEAAPAVSVQVVHSGLHIPWDLGFVNSRTYLLTEIEGRLRLGSTVPGTPLRTVAADFSDLAVGGGGLLGLAIDPQFAGNRTFYTCQTHRAPKDVRVVRWRLNDAGTQAVRVGAPVVSGITDGADHFGCRVVVGGDGKLWVSTGDAARGPLPQSRSSLNGKVLRVNRDGSIPADNPFAGATGKARYLWTYGHRNVQGLAPRPGTGQMWSAEHGPDTDDEINLLRKGGNYGWDPVFPGGQPGYNQQVPMTDLVKYPNAVPAKWSSGVPTVATSGLTFLDSPIWGQWNGAAVVAKLKDTGVMAVRLNAAGTVTGTSEIAQLNNTYGRLRTVRMAPDGSLYVLTSNGGRADRVLRVRPA